MLDRKELPQRDKEAVSGVGIPFGAFVLVHQRDHMPRQHSGILAEENDTVQEV